VRRLRTLMAVAATAMATAAALGALAQSSGVDAGGEATPAHYRNIDELVALGGVWRSRGYGWIWAVEDGAIRTFDESGALCLENTEVAYDVEDLDIRFVANAEKTQLAVTLGDAAYRYTFDRIQELPAACQQPPAADPLSVFDAVVQTIGSHYAFLDARRIDWPALVAEARSEVTAATSDQDLYDILCALLSNFHDAHVGLDATIGDEDFSFFPADEAASREASGGSADAAESAGIGGFWNHRVARKLLGKTRRMGAEREIAYGMIGDDIGYIAIASMADYSRASLEQTLDRAMTLFRNASAVIVDVSMNDGGHDTIARSIATRFVAEPTIAYSKYAGDSPTEKPQPVYLLPSAKPRYTGPVYLLTSHATLSAGEVFVLAMRALPNVTQIGEATNGSFSDALVKPLPNGWTLSLSNEVYLDAKGAAWEGAGVPPQVTLRMRPRLHASDRDVEAARAVVDFIRRDVASAAE